jgi:hypothetical protein
MTPPHIFLERHFSEDHADKLGNDLAPSFTLTDFAANKPCHELSYHLLDLYCISADDWQTNRIECTDQRIAFIEFVSHEVKLKLMVNLVRKNGEHVLDATLVQYDYGSLMGLKKYGIYVFFPRSSSETGEKYQLEIFTKTLFDNESTFSLASTLTLNHYTKKQSVTGGNNRRSSSSWSSTNVDKLSEYEIEYDSLTLPNDFPNLDLRLLSHNSMFIQSEQNPILIEFHTNQPLKLYLVNEKSELNELVFSQRSVTEEKCLFFVYLPQVNKRYKLNLFAQEFVCQFYTVLLPGASNQTFKFRNINYESLCLTDDFPGLDLRLLSHKTKFIQSEQNPILVEFHSNKQLKLHLVDDSNATEEVKEIAVFSQNRFKENKTMFYINLPEANRRFKLRLSANVNEIPSGSLPFVCDFYSELIQEKAAASGKLNDLGIKDYVALSQQNFVFYVEEPIEKKLVRNREYTFRVHFKNVPSEVTLYVTNEDVIDKRFYFVKDEEDASLWTVEMSFNKPGKVQLAAFGFVLGEYEVL